MYSIGVSPIAGECTPPRIRMTNATRTPSARRPARRLARVLLVVAGAVVATGARAAAPGLAEAQAMLERGEAAAALAMFEQLLQEDPESVDAQLGIARAYYALGEYARARIEFEAVLEFDNLPPDLHGQAEVYDRAAAEYAEGRQWRRFAYAETGVGNYRENSSASTDLFGGAGNYDTFLPVRVGGGANSSLNERDSFNASLDYRFRAYDDGDRRNDSDLRWNLDLGRTLPDATRLRVGMRGRVSYRGNGQYRNDWGAFADYRLTYGPDDQVIVTGSFVERRYPEGPLRQRTRNIGQLAASWTHSLPSGRTSIAFGAQLTQEWATQGRPDGDGLFWGVDGEIDHSFHDALDAFFWWSYVNESYDDERPDPGTDAALLPVRNDDLWNFGAGVVWNWGAGWSLRPTVEYNWEDSNIDALAYSSTEAWVTVRKSF